MIPRRALLSAIPAILFAPAIVRVSSLMPVKVWDDRLWIILRGLKADGTVYEQHFEYQGGVMHSATLGSPTDRILSIDVSEVSWRPLEPTPPSPLMAATVNEIARYAR